MLNGENAGRGSDALVQAALTLLAQRLRARGFAEDEVVMMVRNKRTVLEGMSGDELSRRYLVEVDAWEVTGPH